MCNMDENLKKLCRENPKQSRKVVITLSEEYQNIKPDEIGMPKLEEIQGIPGIFKGTFTGEKLLDLTKRNEIKEIVEDFEVDIM